MPLWAEVAGLSAAKEAAHRKEEGAAVSVTAMRGAEEGEEQCYVG